MKLYKFSMLVILLLIVAVAAVTTIQVLISNGVFNEADFARSSVDFLYGFLIVIILLTFCIVQIICLFTRKISLRNLGFFILHAGLVLFLIGSFIYEMVGISELRDMPLNGLTYTQIGIQHENRTQIVDLGFAIGAKDFKLEKYDPIYDLYEKNGPNDWKRVVHDVEPDENGLLHFKDFGGLNENVFNEAGANNDVYRWSEDYIVVRRQPDKYYEASMLVHDLSGGNKKEFKLITNKPYRRNGWIIYLMSYSPDMSSIKLLFKYDPAEGFTAAGIWMIIIGTFIMCFSLDKLAARRKKNG